MARRGWTRADCRALRAKGECCFGMHMAERGWCHVDRNILPEGESELKEVERKSMEASKHKRSPTPDLVAEVSRELFARAQLTPPTGAMTVHQKWDAWERLIVTAWRTGVEAIVTIGLVLIQAKKDIPHGYWEGWIESSAPFSSRTASQLMRIASDPNILRYIKHDGGAGDRFDGPLLPDERTILNEICGQDPEDFDRLVSDRVIHAGMKRGDLKRHLVARQHNSGPDLSPLPQGDQRYRAILADPPWPFATYGAGNTRAPDQHYPTMPLDEICALPVADLAADDCVLFLWVPAHLLHEAPHVMRCWGFHFVSTAFVWVKGGAPGMGYWTRKQTELCLLGTRGAPKRQAADVGELISAPRGRHSEKPGDAHGRIERLVAGPYLELFARKTRPGWDAWGNDPSLKQPGSSS